MSSGPDAIPDPDEAMLARLAALDLAAAERAHERLMAAETSAEFAELGLTYQRLSRSLRQTLALKAKLKHERVPIRSLRPDLDLDAARADLRIEQLQDAVGRVIAAAWPQAPERQKAALDRLDREMDDWIDDELFGLDDLDTNVRDLCQTLDLPDTLAARWRDLPPPAATFDPASRAEAAGDGRESDPPPRESSG